MANAATAFTPETTRDVLDSACGVARLDSTGATLMRMGENAMYHLADEPVVVRIGRSIEASRKETSIARWLASVDFPAVRLIDIGSPQPIIVDKTPVTFWEFIEENGEPATSGDLGSILRRLHQTTGPADLVLPAFEPMPKIDKRLAGLSDRLSPSDLDFLAGYKKTLTEQFADVHFVLGSGPVHGDAHRGNLMRDSSGVVRLIDFEAFCRGPREWDVCVEAVRYRVFGWIDESEYWAFVEAYGFDPLTWPGFPVVRAVRELNMTTWLAQQLGQSSRIDQEVHRRIADLRDEGARRRWRAF